MSFLAIDLGGTKLAHAIISCEGYILTNDTTAVGRRRGREICQLLKSIIRDHLKPGNSKHAVEAIGISVPGIYNEKSGTVWAPNLPEWDNYPLRKELKTVSRKVPLIIQNDRACYIMGERWQGAAKGCDDALFIAVGTGVGVGIISGGRIIQGKSGVAGATGWMALDRSFKPEYKKYGCLESTASGNGIARQARKVLDRNYSYKGILKGKKNITAADVFDAYFKKDKVALQVIKECIGLWGMMTANMVSLFNPERIIFGGGVFGPAISLIPAIVKESAKWAQPISMKEVVVTHSLLGGNAGLYGAAFLAREISKSTVIDA